MGKNREIMTAKEVAEYLSVHPLTVHKYAREGKIPAFKIGTDWRFHRKYIENWIKDKLDDRPVVKAKDKIKEKSKNEQPAENNPQAS